MAKIIYKKGSLFDAPKGAVLLHACNAQGKWGSGIAAEFARRYPDAYKQYSTKCKLNPMSKLLPNGFLIHDKDQAIACLITSKNYGTRVDPPGQIVVATGRAIQDLFGEGDPKRQIGSSLPLTGGPVNVIHIHSPKINSGLFRVPWEQTEAVIEEAIKDREDVTWTVWEQ